MSPTEVTLAQFFFSAAGRFGRAQYWGATFTLYAAVAVVFLPLAWLDERGSTSDDMPLGIFAALGLAVALAAAVSHMLVIVKRFHDRGKPWPWCLVIFVPYVGGLWILIECGCLPGTEGANAYGADPRERFAARPEKIGRADAASGITRRDRSF